MPPRSYIVSQEEEGGESFLLIDVNFAEIEMSECLIALL